MDQDWREYHVTMIDGASLPYRLEAEILFVIHGFRRGWPQFKSDPIGFAGGVAINSWEVVRDSYFAPDTLIGSVTAILLVLSAVLAVLVGEGKSTKDLILSDQENRESQVITLEFPSVTDQLSGSAMGATSKGRVGYERNRGEGSNQEPKHASGGGSGGTRDGTQAQRGRLALPSDIPAPIPKILPPPNATLPKGGIDIDPAIWKSLSFPMYGDPRSNSKAMSNGTGEGGGMGTGNGTGVGEGSGPGVGPGRGGNIGGDAKEIGSGGRGGSSGDGSNDPDRVFPLTEVTQRPRILSKPEPQFTEEARKNQITGTVILRVVFSKSGEVINIRTIQSLPFGLTERAIAAARRIRFLPAVREGRLVSVPMQLEYNFNLY